MQTPPMVPMVRLDCQRPRRSAIGRPHAKDRARADTPPQGVCVDREERTLQGFVDEHMSMGVTSGRAYVFSRTLGQELSADYEVRLRGLNTRVMGVVVEWRGIFWSNSHAHRRAPLPIAPGAF